MRVVWEACSCDLEVLGSSPPTYNSWCHGLELLDLSGAKFNFKSNCPLVIGSYWKIFKLKLNVFIQSYYIICFLVLAGVHCTIELQEIK